AARRRSRLAPYGRAAGSAIRAARPKGSRVLEAVSFAHPPIQISAHARPQLRHLVDRVGADREGSKVEVAGGAGGAPARIFSLGSNQLDLDRNTAVAERRNSYAEAVPDLDSFD